MNISGHHNGSGFAFHKKIAKAPGTTVYFADPYVSWQKGALFHNIALSD